MIVVTIGLILRRLCILILIYQLFALFWWANQRTPFFEYLPNTPLKCCEKRSKRTAYVCTLLESQRKGYLFLVYTQDHSKLGSNQPYHYLMVGWTNRTRRFFVSSRSYCTYLSNQVTRAKLATLTRRSSPKCREPWRPKRRRGGIDTASRASNIETRQTLGLLLNAFSVDWTPSISLDRIGSKIWPWTWPNGGGCHGSSFLVIC